MSGRAVERTEVMFATRALVADDDPILRGLMRARLAGIVDEVVEAADGLEAWQHLLGGGFHLAIVDLNMPSLNGFALIQCMRGHPRTRHMPIVVVTSNEDRASIQRALEVGASAVMTKPVAWSTFKAHIEHLLRLASAAENAERALARQEHLIAAHATLFSAIAGLSHACLRRLGTAVRDDAGPASSEQVAIQISAAQVAADRLAECHHLIATSALVNGQSHRLHDVLAAAVNEARVLLGDAAVVAMTEEMPAVSLVCGREAIGACLVRAVAVLAGRLPSGTSISIACEATSTSILVLIEPAAAPSPALVEADVSIDLPLAAHLSNAAEAFDLAVVRTLLEAHGGALSVTARGLFFALPADRATHPAPRASERLDVA